MVKPSCYYASVYASNYFTWDNQHLSLISFGAADILTPEGE